MEHETAKGDLELDVLDLCWSLAEASPLPMVLVTGSNHLVRYINSAFCRLIGRPKADLLGTGFASSVPSGGECLKLLDRVYVTGEAEIHAGAEHPASHPLYWSYVMWPVRSEGGRTLGVMVQVTETTPFLLQTTAMNQALIISSVRQHELADVAERQAEASLQEQQRLTEQVVTTNEELDRTKAELRALAGSLLAAQEEERRRIARDLHDDQAQRLALIQIELTRCSQSGNTGSPDLSSVIAHVSSLSEELRKLSHRLHPSIIENLGLAAALRSLCEDWASPAGLHVRCSCENLATPISMPASTALYRIAQEALHNVSKHAGDARVTVTLSETADHVQLTIADDGSGFDPRAARYKGGLGLIGMHERATLVGGRIEIRSALGEGTVVRVAVPRGDSSQTAF